MRRRVPRQRRTTRLLPQSRLSLVPPWKRQHAPGTAYLPIAKAATAVRTRVPSRRTIEERAAAAKGAAVPARTAAAKNLDDSRVLILCERGNRHRLCFGYADQGGAGKKRNSHKILHGQS